MEGLSITLHPIEQESIRNEEQHTQQSTYLPVCCPEKQAVSNPCDNASSGLEFSFNACGCDAGEIEQCDPNCDGEDICQCQCNAINEIQKDDDHSTNTLRPLRTQLPFPHQQGKKAKLRTSKDVYDRLKWDCGSILIKKHLVNCSDDSEESLDLSSVYIGYKDRFLGICELPYDKFEPGGDIPFHRVYYFRTGGPPVEPFIGNDGEVKVREDNLPEGSVFIWDRETRTDLVFKSGNSIFLKR